MPRLTRATRAYLIPWIVGLILASPVAQAQGKFAKLTPSSEPVDEGEAVGRGVVLNSRLPGLMAPIGTSLSPPQAREGRVVRPWWVALELGDGQLKLTSDQFNTNRNPAFALGFVGGHSLRKQARIGMELNGWLLQSFNLNNPAVGGCVSDPEDTHIPARGAGTGTVSKQPPRRLWRQWVGLDSRPGLRNPLNRESQAGPDGRLRRRQPRRCSQRHRCRNWPPLFRS